MISEQVYLPSYKNARVAKRTLALAIAVLLYAMERRSGTVTRTWTAFTKYEIIHNSQSKYIFPFNGQIVHRSCVVQPHCLSRSYPRQQCHTVHAQGNFSSHCIVAGRVWRFKVVYPRRYAAFLERRSCQMYWHMHCLEFRRWVEIRYNTRTISFSCQFSTCAGDPCGCLRYNWVELVAESMAPEVAGKSTEVVPGFWPVPW